MTEYEQGLLEYTQGRDAWEAGKAEYEEGLRQLNEGKTQYEEGRKKLAGSEAQLAEGRAEYESGRAEYEQGLKDLADGKQKLEDGRKEYEDGLQEYEDGLRDYEDGIAEYEDGKKTFDEEIADAEQKIADAEEELADLKKPDTYLLERNSNIAYACFESDSQIIRQVATVFPFFFLLVAALVCMTTMTRMVEEQRGRIGTLKGLGYARRDIMGGFLFYAGSAAAAGCLIGYIGGILLFPTVIWFAYQTMYIRIPIVYSFDIPLFAAVMAASLFCALGSTYFSCRDALKENAASLLRPRAPKAGKRIFLERIPAIWKNMPFMRKVMMRNIFRYKKRLFMMVLGIGGCMALLLTGFGLKDSIKGFAASQYDEIQVADAELSFKNAAGNVLPGELQNTLSEINASYIPLVHATRDAVIGSKVKNVDVLAFYGSERPDGFFTLRDTAGEKLALPQEDEALISISIAQRYGLSVGDSFLLRDEDLRECAVSVRGIFENYVYNYVIISPETMKTAWGEADVNSLYVNFREGTDVYESQTVLAKLEDVTQVTILKDFRDRVAAMMDALNYVVLLVIASAGGLAFVVLYNLTNINIIERMREIATIKVLGFRKKETSAYIFRENLILTAMGAAAGLVLGIFLHRFVMSKIVVDLVCFPIRIRPLSFLWSVLLTFGFTFGVNLFMGRKLEEVNMAESLKAVE